MKKENMFLVLVFSIVAFIAYRIFVFPYTPFSQVVADDAHPEWVTNRAALIMDYQRLIAGYEQSLALERSNSVARARAAFLLGVHAGADVTAGLVQDVIDRKRTTKPTEEEYWRLIWFYTNGPSRAIDYK